MLRKKFCLAVCLTVLLLAAAAWAATVNYGGTESLVQSSPVSGVTVDSTGDGTGVGSVIPDEPSHNIVTVNYTPGAGNIDPYRVFGGLSDTDAVSENTATLMDGLITGDFFGGYDAGSSGAFSNKAVIRGGTVGNGDADLSAAAGASQNGDASGNALEWLGGVAKVDIVGGVSGAGKASGNSVLIDATGGAHTEDIYGGHSNQSEASFNSVTLKAGTVKNIEGGRSAGAVNNNRVVITGGNVAGDGASAIVDGGHASTGSAESNTVILDGNLAFSDTDGQEIYGGYSDSGNAQYNTVILRGNQDLQYADLHGGVAASGNSEYNLLNAVGFTGKVKSIQDFQEIKFVLPGTPPSEPIIEIMGSAATDLDGVDIDITGVMAASTWANNDTVTLIQFGSGGWSNLPTIKGTAITAGNPVSIQTTGGTWTFTLSSSASTLAATLTNISGIQEITPVTDIALTTPDTITVPQAVAGHNPGGRLIGGGEVIINKWEIASPGTTEAFDRDGDIQGFTASEPGKVIVRAVVEDGIAPFWPFTKEFTITVREDTPPPPPGDDRPSYTPSDKTTPIEVSVTLSDDVKYTAERQAGGKYPLELPHWADLTRLPVRVVPPAKATVTPPATPPSETVRDFSAGPLTYTITAEDGSKETIEVSAKTAEPAPVPEPEPAPEPEPEPEAPAPSSGGGCDAGAGIAGALAAVYLLVRTRRR